MKSTYAKPCSSGPELMMSGPNLSNKWRLPHLLVALWRAEPIRRAWSPLGQDLLHCD
jgi:hypothetical protein